MWVSARATDCNYCEIIDSANRTQDAECKLLRAEIVNHVYNRYTFFEEPHLAQVTQHAEIMADVLCYRDPCCQIMYPSTKFS